MTREEAIKIIDEEMGNGTSGYNAPWLRVWERLGLITIEKTKPPAQELQAKLRDLMVQIEYRPFQEKGIKKSGCLTQHGAFCIIAYMLIRTMVAGGATAGMLLATLRARQASADAEQAMPSRSPRNGKISPTCGATPTRLRRVSSRRFVFR